MMEHSMQTGIGFAPVLGMIHGLAAFAVFVGALFLIVWAIKHLSAKNLKKWGISLFVGGLIVCVLTIAAAHTMGGGIGMMNVKMMRGDAMSMKGMTMMLDDKTGDDFDKAFLQMMIPHHQGAIDMAKLAETQANHAEIKGMAKKIITTQQKEIDDMNTWAKTWGYETK